MTSTIVHYVPGLNAEFMHMLALTQSAALGRDQRTHLLPIFATAYLRYFLRGTLLTRAERMKFLLLSIISRTMLVVRGLNLTGQFAMYTEIMLLLFIETCSQLYTLSRGFLYGW